MKREVFALILCLLTLAFAFEAKTAWYMPHALGTEVQAAKALPADTPQVISHGIPGQPKLLLLLPITVLIALADLYFRRPIFFFGVPEFDRSPSSSSAFSPETFFRPPPVY